MAFRASPTNHNPNNDFEVSCRKGNAHARTRETDRDRETERETEERFISVVGFLVLWSDFSYSLNVSFLLVVNELTGLPASYRWRL